LAEHFQCLTTKPTDNTQEYKKLLTVAQMCANKIQAILAYNYNKHETHALAHTFNAGSWQTYKLVHISQITSYKILTTAVL